MALHPSPTAGERRRALAKIAAARWEARRRRFIRRSLLTAAVMVVAAAIAVPLAAHAGTPPSRLRVTSRPSPPAGSGNPATAPTTTSLPSSTVPPVPTPTSAPAPATTSTTPGLGSGGSVPATNAAPPAYATGAECQPAQLRAAFAGQGVAAGQATRIVALRNTSGVTCTMVGYPGIQLYDSAGRPVNTTTVRQPPPGTVVTLAPGVSAHFQLSYSDGTGLSNPTCPTYGVGLTPRNDTSQVKIPNSTISPCYQSGIIPPRQLFVTAVTAGS